MTESKAKSKSKTAPKKASASKGKSDKVDEGRRDFIHIAAASTAAVGGALTAWPFIDQMNPAGDTLALASTEVNLNTIAEGSQIKVMWRGRPMFVRHRTKAEIEEAESVSLSDLKDPQTDVERSTAADGTHQPKWLVMSASCTHLGCVPLGNGAGEYNGWFCPCHGSHYDTSGRIRKGPAPTNLPVPEYVFLSDSKIKIG